MKKIILLFAETACVLGLVFIPATSYAVENKMGMTMAYNWWNPAFLNIIQETTARHLGSKVTDKSEGTFMLGPMFLINITKGWNVYGQFLFGAKMNHFEYCSIASGITLWDLIGGNPWNWYINIGKSEVRKYDTDLGFEHAIHQNINLLIGLRFNYAGGEGSSLRIPFNIKIEEYRAWWLGPFFGLGFHWEIKDFSINPGLSLLSQFGQYNLKKRVVNPLNSLAVPYEYNISYITIGFDFNMRLAYLVKKINLELFFGVQYVFLPHIAVEDKKSSYDLMYKQKWITGEMDHFGGINWGAAYKL